MTNSLANSLAALQEQKQVATKELDAFATHRRANANLIAAGAMATAFGVFATVPMSIRQRDWKVWAFPFLVAFSLGFAGAGFESKDSQQAMKVFAWVSQGALATGLIAQNKNSAKLKLETK